MQFSSIWPTDRTLSGVITSGQSEPGSDCNERVLFIPQSTLRLFSVIYRTLIKGRVVYPSAEVQSMYSSVPANWTIGDLGSNP